MRLNEQYGEVEKSYLFSEIDRRVCAFSARHPGREVLRLDIRRPPYPWLICRRRGSWGILDELPGRAEGAGTRGSGFGKNGKSYISR